LEFVEQLRQLRGLRIGELGAPAFVVALGDRAVRAGARCLGSVILRDVRVLLTGATGYIGRAVAEAVAAAGHVVVAAARSEAAETRLCDVGYETVRGDLRRPESLAEAAVACDGVLHLAATQDEDMAASEQATVRAFLAALAGSGKPFVYTSGVWVYGTAPTGQTLDEDSATDPVAIYAWRPALEVEVLAAAGSGVRSVVIRPAMVYGRGGGPLTQFGEMAVDGTPRYVGDGTNHWTLVHVDDLAWLYVLALERAPAGTLINAAIGEKVRDLAAAATAGAGFAHPPVDWQQADAATVLGADVAEALTRDHRISGERARTLLGWEPAVRSPLRELRTRP
jgi:nucleoside-diphosphate-sugar epimerase